MKKTIKKKVCFCDKCATECDYATKCLRCGTELCLECRRQHGVEYSHGVFASGSGDGFYCATCDDYLSRSRSDRRHNAYVAIKSLRNEYKAFGHDFSERSEAAEKVLKSLANRT